MNDEVIRILPICRAFFVRLPAFLPQIKNDCDQASYRNIILEAEVVRLRNIHLDAVR